MEDIVFFYPTGHQAHFEVGHPERPERVEVIREALIKAGWWERYPHVDSMELSQITMQRIHTSDYLDVLANACERSGHLDMDTYTKSASWELAKLAAGGAAATAEAVWQGKARCSLALTRPPGHHSTSTRGMGFCLLNNVALAAEHLLSLEVGGPERLAIVDLDLHHGNGTQEIFLRRKDIFFTSIHQSPLYPGTGRLHETGEGEGEGYTANFPLPPWTGDLGYYTVVEDLILPLLDRCEPEMILVSLGFDTHWRDPLGSMALTATGYGSLIRSLTGWAERNCEGRIALFLEGGYDLEAGAACAQAWVAALLDQDCDDPLGKSPDGESNSWQIVVRNARQFWGLD